MKIANVNIGLNFKPFIIAEMSGNHNQSIETAINIVRKAANIGVSAVKLQTYTPDTITLNVKDGDFLINDKKSIWKGRSLYDLYTEAYTPWEWHREIFEEARKLGIICFSSPFDETAVDLLEELNVPAYKIASAEIKHFPLIKKVAQTGKPIIISTGMASLGDINDAIQVATENGCKNLVLLKCTSTYPASPKDSNILTIPHMKKCFNCEIGLSDHTLGIGASIAAISHGATVIERHFTLDRLTGGVDSSFSLNPDEMGALVNESKIAWQSLGCIQYGRPDSQIQSKRFGRSIYISEDLNAGDILTKDNIRIIRPGFGLAPHYYEIVLGRKIEHGCKKGTALDWEMIS